MSVTAAMVKQLRERTGAGMMECKRALVASNGDIDAAAEQMRKSGQAKADKKADRVAAEGVIIIKQADDGSRGVIVEVNSETDFVAKDAGFMGFANQTADIVLSANPADVAALYAAPNGNGQTVDEARRDLIAKIGENIGVRRFQIVQGGDRLGSYLHGARIGTLVALTGGDDELAKDVAMHVAASSPECLDESGLDATLLEKERDIYRTQAAESGKPPEIIEKMIEGKVRKFVNSVTLLGQPFVKDDKQTVGKLLSSKSATVASFVRYGVGEGIEKKEENFAEEVRKQVEDVQKD
ncbi:MAG: translation elongation factor Ts [Gammaproteobacteria bacterium]